MESQPISHKPPLNAAPMGLFPTMGSLQEVVDFAESKLPITHKNELTSLLMIWQNTLLSVIRVQQQ